ncbi:MAG TPA: hypothetical protein PKC29_15055 [Thermodesulfobacteriota bacterium]|nr:hypothetical protein [Thermodesulfobacteriota bacterium]
MLTFVPSGRREKILDGLLAEMDSRLYGYGLTAYAVTSAGMTMSKKGLNAKLLRCVRNDRKDR